jgi:hypothetical protein
MRNNPTKVVIFDLFSPLKASLLSSSVSPIAWVSSTNIYFSSASASSTPSIGTYRSNTSLILLPFLGYFLFMNVLGGNYLSKTLSSSSS